MARNFNITREARGTIPRAPFRPIKEDILGKDYNLNLIITSPQRIELLNTIYRDIEKPTDILSFPLTVHEGEMYICLPEARKEAKKFKRTFNNFLIFLFIHGCVHLKGYDHGATMERIEEKVRVKFGI